MERVNPRKSWFSLLLAKSTHTIILSRAYGEGVKASFLSQGEVPSPPDFQRGVFLSSGWPRRGGLVSSHHGHC